MESEDSARKRGSPFHTRNSTSCAVSSAAARSPSMENARRKILSWNSRTIRSNSSAIVYLDHRRRRPCFETFAPKGESQSARRNEDASSDFCGTVALAAFLTFLLILVVLYQGYRQKLMLHQERMSALEKGTSIPLGQEPAPWSPRVYLLRGLIWSFSGAALIICLLGFAWSS